MDIIKDVVNYLSSPAIFFVLSCVTLWAVLYFKVLYTVRAGVVMLLSGTVFFAWSTPTRSIR